MGANDYTRAIDKAIAELGVAKTLGEKYAEPALVQARHHINQALDEARRQVSKPEPDRPAAEPVTAHPAVG